MFLSEQQHMYVTAVCAALTPWVHDEATITPSNSEALALDTEASNLALLEDVFQACEVFDLPDKLPLKVLPGADTLGLDSTCLGTNSLQAAAEGACFFDDVESCSEGGCIILHVSSFGIPAANQNFISHTVQYKVQHKQELAEAALAC